MKTAERKGSREARFAVRDGRLLWGGRPQPASPLLLALALSQDGYAPDRDHARIPSRIGRRVLRLATYLAGARILGRTRTPAKRRRTT